MITFLKRLRLKKLIIASNMFDIKYYLFTYADIRFADVDPIMHYIKTGWKEGRNPSANFDTNFYLNKYEDVKKLNINPLVHYIQFGKNEGRITKDLTLTVEDTNHHQTLEEINEQAFVKLNNYEAWKNVNRLNKNSINLLTYHLDNSNEKPLISIIMPVYNPPLKFLQKAIESVMSQIYTNWEICIVDDCSTNTFVRPYLENLQNTYTSIKVEFNQKNSHISVTTNRAVAMAKGDYLIFLDQDDELTKDALAEVVLYINKHNNTDLLYSDDDKIDIDGNCFAPQFKPNFSPEYLLSFMYCGHLKCVKKSLYADIGGFRKNFEGSQDYDFYLRASEKAKHVGHIPKILYHWRVIPGSTAAGGNEKNYSFEAGINALQETLKRRKVKGKAYQPDWALKNGNGIYAIDFLDEGKSVGIVIPTKNGYDLLKRCIDSLKKTTYKNYSIYIIDNESDDPKILSYLTHLKHCKILKILSPNGKFSFSYINNQAVESVKEELVLFLNNDTEVINPKWLSQMVGYLQFNGVGSVGARLLFPNDTIQHAGIIHGLTHSFPMTSGRSLADWDWGYMAGTVTSRNFSAVTAACMLTPKKLFQQLGGFDEINFSVAFNDCDYGYRLYQKGYRNVLAPEALLYHYEGATRGHGDKPIEESAYIRKYGHWQDPYYNPNLALNCSNYSIDSKSVVLHDIPKFRLLMVTHNLNLEGAPKSFYELAKGIKRKGNIEPVVISHTFGPLIDLYKEEGIEVQVIEGFNLFNAADKESIDIFLNDKTEMINSLNVDVIYGNTIESFWAMQCAKTLNIPSIWNIRESEEPFSSYNHIPNIKDLMIESVKFPYKLVFVADATKIVYEPLNTQHNFMTIYNGLDKELAEEKTQGFKRKDLRSNLNINENELAVLILGTVCDRKGQIDLIQAIEKLNNTHVSNMKFFIVGDRKSLDYSKQMHELISTLPQEKQNRITVVDETPEIHKYYLSSDIFICSSRVESFPKVIQEAMYYELAIITTPVFGIVEQVKNNVSALYYEPEDIETLKNHLITLTDNDTLRNTIQSNAKIALDILPTLTEMSSKYEQVFKEAWLSGESR